jgi:hypothetical protein
MPLLSTIGAAAARAFGFLRSLISGYNIANSLRFNSGSSDYLSRTPATATNRKTWTWSGWVKRSNLGSWDELFSATLTTNNTSWVEFRFDETTDTLTLSWYSAGVLTTSQVFRDPSAWYHIVLAVDTTQATASNRANIYINGSLVTAYSTDNRSTQITQNQDTGVNSVTSHTIGNKASNNTWHLDGYLSEVNFIDGQALTASSFGETDTLTGIWKPKAYTGSFGTNGFYLKFANSAALGTDSSGNGNTFTVNNLTSIDQTTDTPTNNFATGNSLIPSTLTYTDGNCTFQRTTSDWESTGSTIALTKGKWYAEFKWISGTFTIIGVEDMALVSAWDNEYMGFSINGRGYGWDGNSRNNGSTSAFGNTFTTGDIIGVALDMDNKFVYMSKNGVFQNSGVPTSGATGTGGLSLSGTEYIIGASAYASTISANFGNPPFTIASGNADANGYGNFEYAVPSGFYALNTKNLANFG